VYVVYEEAEDRGERSTSDVYLYRAPDGLFVNLELVRQGYARGMRSRFEHRRLFRYYEDIARRAEKGIWNSSRPEPPVAEPSDRPADEYAGPDTIVYVTRTGKKYHRADCPHLRFSRKPMRLGEAVKRYGPCGRCHPPRLRKAP